MAALSRVKAPVTLVITAGTNGQHKAGSKHYSGAALDVRSKNFPSRASKLEFLEAIRALLGPNYDCIFEGEGTPNEHFHLEEDP